MKPWFTISWLAVLYQQTYWVSGTCTTNTCVLHNIGEVGEKAERRLLPATHLTNLEVEQGLRPHYCIWWYVKPQQNGAKVLMKTILFRVYMVGGNGH